MERARGSCLCGGVAFEIDLPAKWCANCHCSLCRRANGAAFVTWVGVEEEHFRWLQGEELLETYSSSPSGLRRFCGRCGSPLVFRGTRWPGEVHVVRAALPDALDLRPVAHAWADSKAPWLHIADGLPLLPAPS